jgi:hypothetical protein
VGRLSAVAVIPDAEPVVVEFFRAQPELAELGDRIYTALPGKPTWPAARVVRWGGWPIITEPLVLDEAWCQVDVWADRKAEASRLCRLMRALAAERLVRAHFDIASKVRFGGLLDSPDNSYEPAKPHFRFDMSVLLHPSRPAPSAGPTIRSPL